jgi:hypothetical protein
VCLRGIHSNGGGQRPSNDTQNSIVTYINRILNMQNVSLIFGNHAKDIIQFVVGEI